MPNPMLLNLASKTGVSLEFLEDKWEDAKKVTAEDFGVHIFDFGQKEFDYAKDILMSMINESEQQKKDKIKIFEEFLEYPKKSKDFINESTDLKEFASLDGYKDGYAGRPIDKNYPADTNVEKQEYMLAYQRGKEDREKGTQTFVGAFAESENLKEESQTPAPSVNDTYEDFKNWYMAQGIKQTELDPEVLAQLKQRESKIKEYYPTLRESDKFSDIFKELMVKYNEKRKEWIDKYGSDKGFDEWFTKQTQQNKIPEDAQVSTSLGNISDSPTGIKKDKDLEIKESVITYTVDVYNHKEHHHEYTKQFSSLGKARDFLLKQGFIKKSNILDIEKGDEEEGYILQGKDFLGYTIDWAASIYKNLIESVLKEEEQEIKKQLSIYKRSDGKYGFIGPILLGDEELQDGYKDYQDALDAMKAKGYKLFENKNQESVDGNIMATSDVPYYSKETQEVIENILKEETPEDKTDEAVDGNVMAVSDVPYYTNGEKVEEANKVGQKVKISYQGKTGEAEGTIEKENSNGSYEIKITTDNDPYDKKGTMVTLYPEEFELKEDINDSISRFKKAYPKESKGMTDGEIIDYIKDLKKTGKELDKPFKKFGLGEDQTPPFRSIDTEDDNPRVVPDKEENKEIHEKK